MKTPTLEEVKEYFKDALEVKDYSGSSIKVIDLTGIKLSKFGNYLDCSVKNNFTYFWCSEHGYAEITKYKSTNKVKNPNAKHYELWQDFEAIDIIKATLTEDEYLGYLKGNIIKYKLRDKGQDESDKVKIKDYTNELNNLINK